LVGTAETPQQTVPGRLELVDLALNLPPIMLPKMGRYEFQLYANEVYVGRAVLTVVSRKEEDR